MCGSQSSLISDNEQNQVKIMCSGYFYFKTTRETPLKKLVIHTQTLNVPLAPYETFLFILTPSKEEIIPEVRFVVESPNEQAQKKNRFIGHPSDLCHSKVAV